MNKLVEYLAENYNPGGNSYKIVEVEKVLEDSGFTVDGIHRMALEAYKENLLFFFRSKVFGKRWGVDAMIPGDIEFLGVTLEGKKWYKAMHNCIPSD